MAALRWIRFGLKSKFKSNGFYKYMYINIMYSYIVLLISNYVILRFVSMIFAFSIIFHLMQSTHVNSHFTPLTTSAAALDHPRRHLLKDGVHVPPAAFARQLRQDRGEDTGACHGDGSQVAPWKHRFLNHVDCVCILIQLYMKEGRKGTKRPVSSAKDRSHQRQF